MLTTLGCEGLIYHHLGRSSMPMLSNDHVVLAGQIKPGAGKRRTNPCMIFFTGAQSKTRLRRDGAPDETPRCGTVCCLNSQQPRNSCWFVDSAAYMCTGEHLLRDVLSYSNNLHFILPFTLSTSFLRSSSPLFWPFSLDLPASSFPSLDRILFPILFLSATPPA